MKNETKINAEVTISKMSAPEGYFAHLQIRDKASGMRIVDLTLTFEEFGKAVVGSGQADAKGSVYQSELLGKQMLVSTIEIPLPDEVYEGYDFDEKSDRLNKHIEQYVKSNFPGWTADKEDGMNHHRVHHKKTKKKTVNVQSRTYSVVIRKWEG